MTIRELVQQEALRQGVDPALAMAVAQAESNFNPGAVSPKGAIGVMQVLPTTAPGVDLTDPVQNIRAGVSYLSQMLSRYGREDLALAAYNAGPGAVDRYGGIPPYPETQNYIRSVQAAKPLFGGQEWDVLTTGAGVGAGEGGWVTTALILGGVVLLAVVLD